MHKSGEFIRELKFGSNLSDREKYIKMEELKVIKNRLLLFKLSYSKNVKKYFLNDLFYAEYDEDIRNASKSILQVLFVSNLINVAWAIDADIHVEKVVSNSFSDKGYGLLFSGRIDSATSYIRHKNKKPNLIKVWGADIPLTEKDQRVACHLANVYTDLST